MGLLSGATTVIGGRPITLPPPSNTAADRARMLATWPALREAAEAWDRR